MKYKGQQSHKSATNKRIKRACDRIIKNGLTIKDACILEGLNPVLVKRWMKRGSQHDGETYSLSQYEQWYVGVYAQFEYAQSVFAGKIHETIFSEEGFNKSDAWKWLETRNKDYKKVTETTASGASPNIVIMLPPKESVSALPDPDTDTFDVDATVVEYNDEN